MLSTIAFLYLLTETPMPLAIDPPRRDLGDCRAGTILRGECVLRNTTSSAIEITDVATVCGCQQGTLTRKTLAAGEATKLTFTINTITQPVGANQWKATIEYRLDDQKRTAEVVFFAKITREIDIAPVQIAGSFETHFESTITIHDRRSKPFPVRRVVTGLDILESTIDPMTNEGKQVIHLKSKSELAAGDYADVVHLDTADADYPELKVPIRLTKSRPSNTSIHPEKLTLRWNAGQTTVSGMFVLRAKDEGKAFEIEKVESDSTAIQTKFAVAQAVGSVRVTLDTRELKDGETEVRIHLRDPDSRIVKVPIRWEGP